MVEDVEATKETETEQPAADLHTGEVQQDQEPILHWADDEQEDVHDDTQRNEQEDVQNDQEEHQQDQEPDPIVKEVTTKKKVGQEG